MANLVPGESAGRPAHVKVIFCLVVVLAVLIYASSALSDDLQAAVSTDNATTIVDVTHRGFGAGVQVESERKPFFLTGDFNGDTFQDLLVIVRVKQKGELPAGVSIINPWTTARPDFVSGPSLALAIVHGGTNGWDTESPRGLYLLTDPEFFATPIWEDLTQEDLLSVKKKLRGRRRGPVPLAAKGDAIAVATEAGIDVLLYWDGRTYKLFTPAEEP